uniref:Reverse transcriptase domain-containing protein n=1 Tax=Tanacetum cinerariifolium TaxID=118510 RepID=A0A699HUR3_TANCI|nr:reverse transcriptase domain-containing protein [Tanacetum cinerariifolium]
MPIQINRANARVIKEREATRKAIEEAPLVVKEIPIRVQDIEKDDTLTTKALLQHQKHEVLRFSPSARVQAIILGTDLYLNKLAPSIEGHVSALKSLIKSHNRKNKGDPIRLDFKTEDTDVQDHNIVKGKEVIDEDLRKPFKEAQRTPITRRIIEFAGPEYKMPNNMKLYDGTIDSKDHLSCFASASNSEEWPMHVWCRMFQQTLDGSARGWFKRLPRDSINEWADLREAFAARFSVRRAFKSPELAKRFLDKVPTTVNEMMERLEDFVRSEEAYASIELPKGETRESHRKISFPSNRRDVWPLRNTRSMESRRDDYRNRHRGRDTCHANRPRDGRAPYPPQMGEYNRRVASEKGHYTNDCIQLRKQIEMALESRKLNHLQKIREAMEPWMNIPITFSAISVGDIFEEPLIVEDEVEGNLVRRVYVDEGSLVKPLGKIELEAHFGNKGLCRRTSMKFIVVQSPSPYNIILGRPGLKTLRAIPSTIHAMMKFPTPKGVATLVTQMVIITECRRLEKRQMVEEESPEEKRDVALTEEVLVNPSFPDQLVAIGRGLSEAGKDQLKCLLKDNMEIFAWEPSNMTGVPRRIIEHALNVNPSLDPVCQKRRTFSMEKSGVVTNEAGGLDFLIPNRKELGGICGRHGVDIGGFPLRSAERGKGRIVHSNVGGNPGKRRHGKLDLFTDGASCPKGSGAGLVLIGPNGIEYTYAFRLTLPSTNNEAEYEALLAGKDSMLKYMEKEKEYAFEFKSFSIENIPRNMNQKADVLSKLASVAFNHLTKEVLVEVLNERSTEGQEIHTVVEEE